MGEKERIRRRREALQYSRRRRENSRQPSEENKAFFLFRTYVTMMIVAITMAVSFIQTEYTQQLRTNIKEAIAYQTPPEKLHQLGSTLLTLVQRADVTVFRNKQEQKQPQKTNQEPVKKEDASADAVSTDTQEFQPDLAEEGEIP
ncbi:MAG: hypothetical protein GX299_00470 [Epulopiscium sp.]|nr:hypothetical protein [Candidatus Epulonipiscium sp.]